MEQMGHSCRATTESFIRFGQENMPEKRFDAFVGELKTAYISRVEPASTWMDFP